MQGIYAERLPRRFIFFQIHKILHSLGLEKMSTKKTLSIGLAGFRQVRTLHWKVLRLKEVLTITENNIKIASG